jgi:hypothetical protein
LEGNILNFAHNNKVIVKEKTNNRKNPYYKEPNPSLNVRSVLFATFKWDEIGYKDYYKQTNQRNNCSKNICIDH